MSYRTVISGSPLPQPLAALPATFGSEHDRLLHGRATRWKHANYLIQNLQDHWSCRQGRDPQVWCPGGVTVSTSLVDKREARIRRMFGNIAPSYDLLNHLLSLNIDHYWRWRTTRLVRR